MTNAGQPTIHYPTIHGDTLWMLKAACTPNPAWTSENKPTQVLPQLRAICSRCPVIADCANYALEHHLHGGVYAGVYLPSRHGAACNQARLALHRLTRPVKGTK